MGVCIYVCSYHPFNIFSFMKFMFKILKLLRRVAHKRQAANPSVLILNQIYFFSFEQNCKSSKLREYYRQSMCFRKCDYAVVSVF